MIKNRRLERSIALLAFISANAMGYLSFFLAGHTLASGVLWFIAQMLTLCATILGIDYKANAPNK